jgi:membrane protein
MPHRQKAPKTSLLHGIRRLVERYYLHDVGRDSAALSYYLLFAIFPLLIFISALIGALHLDVNSIIRMLSQLVPESVTEVVEAYLTYVSENASQRLLWFSLVFSIWFPMRSTSALMHSIRKAYGLGTPRSMVLSQVRIFLFTIWLIVTIALVLVLVTVGRRVLVFAAGLIYISPHFIDLWNYLRFVILAVYMFATLVVLYLLAQGRKRPMREVLPGAGLSLLVWMVFSMAFSYYVENMAHYAQLYGSIATIIVVLIWLYTSGTMLIMGAEFNGMMLEMREEKLRNQLTVKIAEEGKHTK